jgi:hypothetical protein
MVVRCRMTIGRRSPRGWRAPLTALVAWLALAYPPAAQAEGADSLSAASPAKPTNPPATSATPTVTAPPAESRNLLPFAQNELPTAYPRVSVSIGMAGYVADFGQVEQAFRTMEEAMIAQGFAITTAGDIAPGAMVTSAFTLWINRSLDVTCQAAKTNHSDDELTLLGGLVSGHYTLRSARSVSLSLGLGGGKYGFNFSRRYDAAGPNSTVLQTLSFDGGGPYWTTAGGLTVRTGPHGAVQGNLQYIGVGDESTDTPGGKVTLNLSGVAFGGSFTLFF